MKKLNAISLFSGCGGLDLGFKKAGFNMLLANDIDKYASQTYKENFPETKFILGDIRQISIDDIKNKIKGKRVDVIIGGPPCQGFSNAGLRDPKDPRNSLFMEFIRIVAGFNPKYVVIENVPGILTMKTANGDLVKDIITQEFAKIGYKIESKILLSADYGVPQKRRRVIFIGTNTGKPIVFPQPTHAKPELSSSLKPWISAYSVLLDNRKIGNEYFLSQRMIDGFIKRKNKNKLKGNGFGWQFLKKGEPSYTISARYWKDGSDALVYYSKNKIRMLTERECARIQSFPDDFIFTGSRKEIYRQIGNAVPPLLAENIAKSIKKNIKK